MSKLVSVLLSLSVALGGIAVAETYPQPAKFRIRKGAEDFIKTASAGNGESTLALIKTADLFLAALHAVSESTGDVNKRVMALETSKACLKETLKDKYYETWSRLKAELLDDNELSLLFLKLDRLTAAAHSNHAQIRCTGVRR